MKNIFVGMLFIFLDFNINLGSSTIGLIPDFLGYLFLINGLNELSIESDKFMKVRPYANGMVIYTIILYAMDLFGFQATLGYFTIIFGLISTIVSLYISYYIVLGIKDIETAHSYKLNSETLFTNWKYLAIFTISSFVLIFIPFVNIISIIIGFIVAICFLIALNNTKNLYLNQE